MLFIPRERAKWKSIDLYAFITDIPPKKISAFPSHELCYTEDVLSSAFFRSAFFPSINKAHSEGWLCLENGKLHSVFAFKSQPPFCNGICLLFLSAEAGYL